MNKKIVGDRYHSTDAENFKEYLNGVFIYKDCYEGSIDLRYLDEEERPSRYGRNSEDIVHIAIIHDGSGYTPGGALVVLQNEGSPNEAVQAGYEVLENRFREDKDYMDDISKDVKIRFMEEHNMPEAEFQDMLNGGDSQLFDDYWTLVDEWAFEAFDGKAWTLNAEEAARIISEDKYASKGIDITWPEESGTEHEKRYY